jgi:hypothetical protein
MNMLLFTGIIGETICQSIRLPVGDHPADHRMAMDIEDHIEIDIDPLGRAFGLGDNLY